MDSGDVFQPENLGYQVVKVAINDGIQQVKGFGRFVTLCTTDLI